MSFSWVIKKRNVWFSSLIKKKDDGVVESLGGFIQPRNLTMGMLGVALQNFLQGKYVTMVFVGGYGVTKNGIHNSNNRQGFPGVIKVGHCYRDSEKQGEI